MLKPWLRVGTIEAAAALTSIACLMGSCTSSHRTSHDPDASSDGTDTATSSETDDDTGADTDTDTGTDTAPNGWHWEDLPEEIDWGVLHDITGRDAGDVVAVGWMHLPYGQGDRQILRFAGDAWQLDPYEAETFSIMGKACLSGGDTYYLAPHVPNPDLLILTGIDDSWATVPPPDLCPEGFNVASGSVASYMTCLETPGFTVAFYCEIPGPSDDPLYLVANDGTDWTIVLGPESLSDTGIGPFFVWGQAVDDLVLFECDGTFTPGYHFNGVALTPMTAAVPAPCDIEHSGIRGMDGDDEHGYGYYAVGAAVPEDASELQGLVWHSENEIDWVDDPVPHPPDPETYWELLEDVWISDGGEVYVVGERYFYDDYPNGHPFAVLLRFNGEEWEDLEVPPHPDSDLGEAGLYGVWGTGGEVFAAGYYLLWGAYHPAILHYVPE